MEKHYRILDIDQIHADDEFNCRGAVAPLDVVELAKDIQHRGLIQPVSVIPYSIKREKETGYKYRLLAGFRRIMAMRLNKAKSVEAIIIVQQLSEAEAIYFNLAENVQRKDLNIVQEAQALQRLKTLGVTEFAAANKLGKSRGWVQVRYMLLALPSNVQDQVAAGFIAQTGIRDLYAVNRTVGKDDCIKLAADLKKIKLANQNKPRTKKKNLDKNNPTVKKLRSRLEMFEMQDHIFEVVGNGLATRCLAWAAGEINDNDLFGSIKNESVILNVPYTIPNKLGE